MITILDVPYSGIRNLSQLRKALTILKPESELAFPVKLVRCTRTGDIHAGQDSFFLERQGPPLDENDKPDVPPPPPPASLRVKKPPLGIMDRKLHRYDRIKELLQAIERCSLQRTLVPPKWIEELRELVEEIAWKKRPITGW